MPPTPGADGIAITPATLEDDELGHMKILEDRYTVSVPVEYDAAGFVEDVGEDETERYEIKAGSDWAETGPREMVEAEALLDGDREAVYVKDEQDRFSRSFYAATDRDGPAVEVVVPTQAGMFDVTPLYDALDPFYDDGELMDAVDAVEARIKEYRDGELDAVRV